ncbi:MAG: AbrB/MazE/SpoVT family DNA-binding domain-containing protein [Rubrivivax sp.]
MRTTVLSSKGQVIIPKTLRVERRWGPGTRLEVHDTPEGVLLRPADPTAKVGLASGLAAIRRRLGYSGPALSVTEMDAAVLREAQMRAQSIPQPAQPDKPDKRPRKTRG